MIMIKLDDEQERMMDRGGVDIAFEMKEGRSWTEREAWIFDRLYRMAIDDGMWGLLSEEFKKNKRTMT
jgi:hypothetical protein